MTRPDPVQEAALHIARLIRMVRPSDALNFEHLVEARAWLDVHSDPASDIPRPIVDFTPQRPGRPGDRSGRLPADMSELIRWMDRLRAVTERATLGVAIEQASLRARIVRESNPGRKRGTATAVAEFAAQQLQALGDVLQIRRDAIEVPEARAEPTSTTNKESDNDKG